MIRVADQAHSTLSASCGVSDTSVSVTSTASFPTLSVSDHTYLVLTSNADGGRELVRATAIVGNAITIQRAQGGSAARAFLAGDRIELRQTALLLNELIKEAVETTITTTTQIANLTTTAIAYLSATQISAITTTALGGLTSTQINALSSTQLAGLSGKLTGAFSLFVPASAMLSRTTNGAAPGILETSTNKVMLSTLDFDAATIEYAQFSVQMPDNWNGGTVTADFVWSHPSTATNFGVVWGIQGVALADDDAADTAFGSAQTVADTGGTTGDVYKTTSTPALTIANTPSAGDWVVFQIYRNATDATNDTMTVDARLHGISIEYGVNSYTVA